MLNAWMDGTAVGHISGRRQCPKIHNFLILNEERDARKLIDFELMCHSSCAILYFNVKAILGDMKCRSYMSYQQPIVTMTIR